MKTIAEIKQLPDDTWFDGFAGEVIEVYPSKRVGKGTVQNAIVKDSTGTVYVGFGGKNNQNQPIGQKGNRITLSGKGIKFKKNPKYPDGKYDQITVLDAAEVQFGSNGPQQQTTQQVTKPVQTATQVQPAENIKDLAIRIVKEWIQLRIWIAPVIEEAGLPVDRELITNILMGLRSRGVTQIPLEGDKKDWRGVTVNKFLLGDSSYWTGEKLGNLVIYSIQNPNKLKPDVVEAINSMKEELKLLNVGLLEMIVSKAGVGVDAYAAVLLEQMIDFQSVTEEQALKLIKDPEFPAKLKAKQEMLNETSNDIEIPIDG